MDELAKRIEARLNEALDRQVAAELYIYDPDDRGLAAGEPGSGCVYLRLTLADVARIAAAEAHAWF